MCTGQIQLLWSWAPLHCADFLFYAIIDQACWIIYGHEYNINWCFCALKHGLLICTMLSYWILHCNFSPFCLSSTEIWGIYHDPNFSCQNKAFCECVSFALVTEVAQPEHKLYQPLSDKPLSCVVATALEQQPFCSFSRTIHLILYDRLRGTKLCIAALLALWKDFPGKPQ